MGAESKEEVVTLSDGRGLKDINSLRCYKEENDKRMLRIAQCVR